MKDLLEFIVKPMLLFPNEMKIEEIVEPNSMLLKLSINKEDMGKVIGKEGKIIKAIRTLLKVRGLLENQKIDLQLVEPL
jgi:predicted RNA-binding protein YlqC (UPF0109 family)